MKILEAVDGGEITRYSSIDQYKDNFLCVIRGGRAVPISFDVIDYIRCEKGGKHVPVSHRAILSDGRDIGYHFPVGYRKFISDLYVRPDLKTKAIREAPDYYGIEFYEEYLNCSPIVTSDSGALGVRNVNTLRIGQSYILADETLPADDIED